MLSTGKLQDNAIVFDKKINFYFSCSRVNNAPFVSLSDPDTNADVFKGLVSDGLLLVEKRREKRLLKLVSCVTQLVYFYFIIR